jgi:hypothetical protein
MKNSGCIHYLHIHSLLCFHDNCFYYLLLLLLLQICVMIHSGSRGLGHQVATDALTDMEAAMARDGLVTNDRQLACARINSKVGTAGIYSYSYVIIMYVVILLQ